METLEKPEIVGYRQLSEGEVVLMNECKNLARICGSLVNVLRGNPKLDQRWVSIGATDLQTGFMALVRSIAQPTTF